jgi:hypothetical protein
VSWWGADEGVIIMKLSDISGQKQAPEGDSPLALATTDFMKTRKQPSESSAEKGLSGRASHGTEYARGIDHLIQGLVDVLPKPDEIWPLHDRSKWLRLAAGIFDLGYKAGDGEHRDEISITVVKQEAINRATSPSTARTTAREGS